MEYFDHVTRHKRTSLPHVGNFYRRYKYRVYTRLLRAASSPAAEQRNPRGEGRGSSGTAAAAPTLVPTPARCRAPRPAPPPAFVRVAPSGQRCPPPPARVPTREQLLLLDREISSNCGMVNLYTYRKGSYFPVNDT